MAVIALRLSENSIRNLQKSKSQYIIDSFEEIETSYIIAKQQNFVVYLLMYLKLVDEQFVENGLRIFSEENFNQNYSYRNDIITKETFFEVAIK